MKRYGLDLSEHQARLINDDGFWEALMQSQFKDFIILRRGYGVSGTEDKAYKGLYNRAYEAGIRDISSYWFSYALSPADAVKEAEEYVRLTENDGLGLNCMILDFEDNSYWKKNGYTLSSSMANAHCSAFLDVLKAKNLNCAVYASQWVLQHILDWRALGVAVWNAAYDLDDEIKAWMFQYTESQYIGNYGPFDANVVYG